MPKGQKPYLAQRKRPLTPRVGLTTFGKDKAETTASIEAARQKVASKAAPAAATQAGMKGDVMGYNKHRPVTERGGFLDEEIEKRSR
jgi:hypothetical protein